MPSETRSKASRAARSRRANSVQQFPAGWDATRQARCRRATHPAFTCKGQKNLDARQAEQVQGKDFNHLIRDLVDAINRSDCPKRDLYVQVLKPEQLASFDFNPLDATKIWPGVPERKIGTLTLNKNPGNVFQETEQSAFALANLVPGIEPSEDRRLQGRMFSYADTQLYRVGTNVLQLPINHPKVAVVNNNQDGAANSGLTTSNVNYQPSRVGGVTAMIVPTSTVNCR